MAWPPLFQTSQRNALCKVALTGDKQQQNRQRCHYCRGLLGSDRGDYLVQQSEDLKPDLQGVKIGGANDQQWPLNGIPTVGELKEEDHNQPRLGEWQDDPPEACATLAKQIIAASRLPNRQSI